MCINRPGKTSLVVSVIIHHLLTINFSNQCSFCITFFYDDSKSPEPTASPPFLPVTSQKSSDPDGGSSLEASPHYFWPPSPSAQFRPPLTHPTVLLSGREECYLFQLSGPDQNAVYVDGRPFWQWSKDVFENFCADRSLTPITSVRRRSRVVAPISAHFVCVDRRNGEISDFSLTGRFCRSRDTLPQIRRSRKMTDQRK
jgi:hypothetical protein